MEKSLERQSTSCSSLQVVFVHLINLPEFVPVLFLWANYTIYNFQYCEIFLFTIELDCNYLSKKLMIFHILNEFHKYIKCSLKLFNFVNRRGREANPTYSTCWSRPNISKIFLKVGVQNVLIFIFEVIWNCRNSSKVTCSFNHIV